MLANERRSFTCVCVLRLSESGTRAFLNPILCAPDRPRSRKMDLAVHEAPVFPIGRSFIDHSNNAVGSQAVTPQLDVEITRGIAKIR